MGGPFAEDYKKEKAKEVLIQCIESDGYQEMWDGASSVIDAVWGNGTARSWVKEWEASNGE